jgi:DNA-binding response OmpR family regulator
MSDWADVLIVEDESRLRFFATEVFRLEGISAAAVPDGCEAVNYFQNTIAENGKMPRVMILDMGLPCLTGYELYQQIANEAWASELYVIITSAAGEPIDPLDGFAGTLMLNKPYEVNALLNKIRSVAPEVFPQS